MTDPRTTGAAQADNAIDRLLAAAEPVSIVDGLFELSHSSSDAVVDGWQRAVYNRLQARLANRMRSAMARTSA